MAIRPTNRASLMFKFSIIIPLELMFIYLLCHLHELQTLWDYFLGFNPMSTVFRYIKVAFLLWYHILNDLPGLGKCAFCLMAFLTMTIKYLPEFFREIY